MAQTVGQIAQGVLNRLSVTPGLSQQTYAQPRIIQAIEDTIAFVMEETHWAPYVAHSAISVVDGRMTQDLLGAYDIPIDDFSDIIAVFNLNGDRKFSQWNLQDNPNALMTSGQAFLVPDYSVPHRPFRIIPVDFTETVTVHSYAHPIIPISVNDIIRLDPTMISIGATYMIAAGDSISSGDTTRLQAMFTERIKQMVKGNEVQSFALDASNYGGTNVWWTAP